MVSRSESRFASGFGAAVIAPVVAATVVCTPSQVAIAEVAAGGGAVEVAALPDAPVLRDTQPDTGPDAPVLRDAQPETRGDSGGSSQSELSSQRKTVGNSNLTAGEIALIVLAVVVLAPPILIHVFYAMI